MGLLKFLLGSVLVRKSTLVSMFIALLSLSDYIWLMAYKVNMPSVAIFFVFFVITLIIFINCNSSHISVRKLLLLLFISLYFVIKSIYNNDNFGVESFTMLLSFLTAFFCYIIFNYKNLFELLDLFSKTLLFYMIIMVFFELANKASGGVNLIIVFQNNLAYLLLFFILYKRLSNTAGYRGGDRAFKYSLYLLLIYILFAITEFGNYRVQFKIIILLAGVIVPFLFERSIVKHFKLFKSSLLIFIVLSICFFWLIKEQIELFINLSGRLGSGLIRIEIFNSIIDQFKSPADFLLGLSLGSSATEFKVFYNNSMYLLHSHAGLASLLLDYGLLGIFFLFLVPCVLLLFKVRDYPQSFLYAFLLIICWLYLNILYLSAIPIANVYNFSMLPLILISINLFIKSTNFEKTKNIS